MKYLMLFIAIAAALSGYGQRARVNIADLPGPMPDVYHSKDPLPDFLRNQQPGFTVKNAYKDSTNGVVTYEVELKKGGIKRTLVYDQNGTFLKTGVDKVSYTPIQLPNVLNLPGPIPTYLDRNYAGCIVESAFKVVTKANETSYEIGITKETIHSTLYFSGDGNFIRSESPNTKARRRE